MAELFADPSFWKNNGQQPAGNYTGIPEVDRELDKMPEDERQAAIAEITAPPTGEEIAGMIQSKLAVGEVANVSREQYRLYKAYSKTKETDIMEAIGMGADMVWNDLQKAAGSMYDKPVESVAKLTPSLIEAFSQGTRNLYGMLAESQDPNSTLFRVKNAIYTGGDEESEYNQFMDALDFNAKSNRLMQGKETLVMDKDLINPEMTQAMSYIADPTLFIPFEGVALKGAQLVGMSEGLAKAAARASAIKHMVMGGALKWGVGAPIEFIGGATRATIDGAIERGSRVIEAATGMEAADIAKTARMTGMGSMVADAAGMTVPFGTGISEAYVGATAARGVGEAIGAIGGQVMKGERGVLSYAKQALEESAAGGAKLTPHAENLLKAIDFFDPMFSYTADVTKGATHGMAIGAGLGYLGGGEEGMAQGMGAGGVLGGVGAGFGRIYADISGGTRVDRVRISTDMVLNTLAETNPTAAKDYMTLRAVAEAKGVNIDSYIAGLNTLAPDLHTYFKSVSDHSAEITAAGFDPKTYDGSFVDKNGRRLFSMAEFERAEGFVIDKAKDGKITLGINLDNLKENTVPHEAFHTIFRSVVMEPEFQRRMTENVLGVFDKDGKQISPPKVSQAEAVAFFDRYLKALHKGEKLNEQRGILKQALEEYYRDGQTKIMAEDGKTPYLANLSEEFGAYYFTQFIKGKPLDYLFLGGELGGVRGIMESVQDGWLDYWETRAKRVEPKFDMLNPDGIDYAFKPKGGKRVRVGAIDYLMQDLVRAASQRRKDGSINLSRMSRDTREQFFRAQGLDGVGETRAKPTRIKAVKGQNPVNIYNKTFGPEVHKALLGLHDNVRPKVDGNGDFTGPLSKEVLERIVATGHMSREMANKIQVLQDMAAGRMQSNIAEMGYIGWSEQQGVGPNPPRLYGDDVSYKRRKVLVLGVESKIGPKGMSFNARTLDWHVIETRANNLWSDSRVQKRWNDDRSAFVQDFFRYLTNASKSDAEGRVPSNKLWAEDGDAKRDIMQQMAGIPRNSGETYAHPPIAEIHEDILNSVMNLTVNRMSDVRVTGDNVFFDAEKAAPFIRVNMKVADMPYEDTPNGKVFTDKQSGFRFTQTAKGVTAFDRHGEQIGSYANLEDAGKFAKRVYERQQAAMKEVAVQVTDEASRGVTYKSKSQFVDDRIAVTKDENVKAQVIKHLEDQLKPDADSWNQQINKAIEAIKTEGLSRRVVQEVAAAVPVEYNGQKLYLAEHIKAEEAPANAAWEAMFPRTFRSRLLDKVQSLHEANPNLSYQGLIKKLLRDSSNGYRFYAEAEAIGLTDFLRSKIDPVTKIQKQRDNQGNWTGGIKEVRQPFAAKENFGGRTDIPIDIEEISNWIYNKELTLQVDDGARANISDTSGYVQEGTTLGYNETAIRMPQQYAHGISGHYGPDVVVHHRSTVRKDVNGEQVIFVDEIQANNAKELIGQKKADVSKVKADIKATEDVLAITRKIQSLGLPDTTDSSKNFIKEIKNQPDVLFSEDTRMLSNSKIKVGPHEFSLSTFDYEATEKLTGYLNASDALSKLQIEGIISNVESMGGVREFVKKELETRIQYVVDKGALKHMHTLMGIKASKFLMDNVVSLGEIKLKELKAALELANSKEVAELGKHYHDAERGALGRAIRIMQDRDNIQTYVIDFESKIQQLKKSLEPKKAYPLQEISEWSAVAIKDIITKSIQDGIDLITITHPDDSPTKSGMASDARQADYGRIFPQVAQKIVGKYGIEVRQRNELPALTEAQMATDKAYKDASEARNKAQADAIEVFNKTQGQGESPDVISELARQFSRTPENLINEFTDFGIGVGWFEDKIMPLLSQVKSEELRNKLTDVAQRITQEAAVFNGVKESIYSQYDPSVVAIDRGMSFRLNKEIKEAVMQGELRTAFKPAEAGEEGGRTYTDRQLDREFIGRYAAENPSITEGVKIRYEDRMEEDDRGYGMKVIYLKDNNNGKEIGSIKFELEDDSFYINQNSSIQGKFVKDISVKVSPEYQGKKYQHLLYSEMLERARSLDVIAFRQEIENELGLPLKSTNKIVGQDKSVIWTLVDHDLVSPTQENFDRIMARSPQVVKRGFVHVPSVSHFGELDPKAWYKPEEGEKAPVNWKKERFNVEGYNAEVIWMKPSRFLNLAAKMGDIGEGTKSREKINAIKQALEKKGGDMDMPHFFMRRTKSGELKVGGHEGRHRAVAIQELYGDKLIPVYLQMSDEMKQLNAGNYDWGVPESKKMKGKISSEFKALEGSPFLNEAGTARFKPEEGDAPLRVNFSPDEVKKNLRSLQSAIDRQSDKDKVPAGIKKGVGRLIQAIERQRKEDVKGMPQAVKEGFKALADAVDAQADMDKVPAGVRKGLRLLFEAAQYEDLKPQQAMPKPTASEEQLASGIEALGRAVGVKGQVRRQPSPQAKPEPTAAMPEAKSSPAPQPTPTRPVPEPSSTAWMSWTQEKTETGGFIKNAIGYVIVVNKGKFKVYNPAKALIGIYEDETQAKRRVLKDMPRR